MWKTASRLLAIFCLVLLGVSTALGDQKNEAAKKRAKARYFYMKGAVKEAEGKNDEAFEFYKKAYETDPGYSDASYAYGLNRSALREDTFKSVAEFRKDMELMRPLLDMNPADAAAAERYAYAASLSDTLEEGIRVFRRLLKERPGLSRLYMPLSYYYGGMGKMDSAVYAIREFERLEGATTETTLRKVTAWLATGDTLAALAEAREYAANNTASHQPIVDKAMIYSVLGQQDSAIIFLEDALNRFPERSEVKFDIGLLYAEKGDSAKFHKLVDEAFRGEDLEYEDRMAMLDMYIKSMGGNAGDFAESDRFFEYAATLYPEDADFYDLFTSYQLRKGDFEGALEMASKALELNPTEPSFLGRVLSFSAVTGKFERGLRAFDEFPAVDAKKDYNILLTYVSVLQASSQYDKVEAWLDTLLSTEVPGMALRDTVTPEKMTQIELSYTPLEIYRASVAYEVAGDSYSRMGREADVVRSYENSIVLLDSMNTSALNNYAYYIVETMKAQPESEMFEKAKRMSRKSLEGDDEPQSTYLDTYAWILFKEGNYKGALEYQEMAMEAEGEAAASEMYSHYGDILYMNGREEEALESWEKALELNPGDSLLKRKVEQKTYIDE